MIDWLTKTVESPATLDVQKKIMDIEGKKMWTNNQAIGIIFATGTVYFTNREHSKLD